MLGIIQSLGKKYWAICPFCGHLMQYTKEKWSEIGLWCGSCVYGQRQMASKYGIVWDEKNNRPLDYVFPRFLGPFPLYWNPEDLCCIICETRSTISHPMSFFLLFHDLTQSDELTDLNADSSSRSDLNTGRALESNFAKKSMCAPFFSGRLGYYPLCCKHARPYVSMTPKSMRISNLMYSEYRISDANTRNDELLQGGLKLKNADEMTGDVNILDCMDSTALYYEASCRKRRKIERDLVKEFGIEYSETKKMFDWDNDALFKHISTSKYREKYSEDGFVDEDMFPGLYL
jgi:hypothetical protein